MKYLRTLFEKAELSAAARKVLDIALSRTIPFNRPHKVAIETLTPTRAEVRLPHRRGNCNHVGGLHACALAMAAEYCSGLLLLRRLGAEDYRLIMKSLAVEYLYQGKSDARAVFELGDEQFRAHIAEPLEKDEPVIFDAAVKVEDAQRNLLCKATIVWQIKPWRLVRSRS